MLTHRTIAALLFFFSNNCRSVGDRLAISVTLYLALIAFQVVLTNYIPPTAYQTRMHQFILWATIIMTTTVLETLTVFYAFTVMKANADLEDDKGQTKGLEKLLDKGIKSIIRAGTEAKISPTTVASRYEKVEVERDIAVEEIDEDSLTSDELEFKSAETKFKKRKLDNSSTTTKPPVSAASAALMIAAGVSPPQQPRKKKNRNVDEKTKKIKQQIHIIDQVCLFIFPVSFAFVYWHFLYEN